MTPEELKMLRNAVMLKRHSDLQNAYKVIKKALDTMVKCNNTYYEATVSARGRVFNIHRDGIRLLWKKETLVIVIRGV